MAKWAILGAGGSFALHTALHVLDHKEHQVIGIGRSPLQLGAFSIGIQNKRGFYYSPLHLSYDHDQVMSLLDLERPQVIVNFAAQGEGALSWDQSWRFFETNCVGLSKFVEALSARDYCQRFIHIGSSEVYGSVEAPATEDSPIRPTSPYAASKAGFDLYLASMFKVKQFPMNILRPCNAYGPAQRLHRIIPRAIVAGLKGERVPLHGGGRAEKSYIHARDLARAIYLVAERAPPGAVYNVGPKDPTPIRRVVEHVAEALGFRFVSDLIEVVGERPGQDARYWLDSSAIRNATGWKPRIEWQQGLAEMVRWGRCYFDELKAAPTEYVVRP